MYEYVIFCQLRLTNKNVTYVFNYFDARMLQFFVLILLWVCDLGHIWLCWFHQSCAKVWLYKSYARKRKSGIKLVQFGAYNRREWWKTIWYTFEGVIQYGFVDVAFLILFYIIIFQSILHIVIFGKKIPWGF